MKIYKNKELRDAKGRIFGDVWAGPKLENGKHKIYATIPMNHLYSFDPTNSIDDELYSYEIDEAFEPLAKFLDNYYIKRFIGYESTLVKVLPLCPIKRINLMMKMERTLFNFDFASKNHRRIKFYYINRIYIMNAVRLIFFVNYHEPFKNYSITREEFEKKLKTYEQKKAYLEVRKEIDRFLVFEYKSGTKIYWGGDEYKAFIAIAEKNNNKTCKKFKTKS